MSESLILAINPGSTSTKIAVFQDSRSVFMKNLSHKTEELSKFKKISEQFQFRKDIIIEEIDSAGISLDAIKIVVGRGGKSKLKLDNNKMFLLNTFYVRN